MIQAEDPQETQVARWLADSPVHRSALQAASSLGLNDWCLAAGFVRNIIWDNLHQYPTATPLNDVDLIYFNRHDVSEQADRALENRLAALTDHPWSVKNQARMHRRNGDAPYRSTKDAMSYWIELETAVGAYLDANGNLQLVTPFGLQANFQKTVTQNPKRPKPDVFQARIERKQWLTLWPQLVVHY